MTQKAEIRGYSAKQSARPAGLPWRVGSWLIDLGCAMVLFLVAVKAFGVSPIPRKRWIVGIALSVAFFRWILRYPLKATLGEKAWGLGYVDGKIREVSATPDRAALFGGILTVFSVAAFYVVADQVAFSTPLWTTTPVERLQPYLPLQDPAWSIEAFYYTLGAWPKSYHGRPVFYALPYQKGPPTQFIGQIEANWDTGVRVTLEGPKTPVVYQDGVRTRDDLKSCLTSSPLLGGARGVFGCLALRDRSLGRHIEAMEQRLHPKSWKVQWFLVENGAIPAEEQAQGIHIEAVGRNMVQSRYILVTAKGVHEAVIGTFPASGEDASRARDTLEKVVSSLRVSDDLNPGRAWVDRQLESVKLDELKKLKDPAKLPDRLAEIEATLLSKISVEPKTFDAYFHLGGIAMMIAREGARVKEPEWQASSNMIGNLTRYAKDLAPQDGRTTQLENLWLESKKL